MPKILLDYEIYEAGEAGDLLLPNGSVICDYVGEVLPKHVWVVTWKGRPQRVYTTCAAAEASLPDNIFDGAFSVTALPFFPRGGQ